MPAAPRLITLTEYEPQLVDRALLPDAVGERLWQQFGRYVSVVPPSFQTGQRWQLTARGWVGHIPLTPQLRLLLQPKVPVGNLLTLLTWAYGLEPVRPPGATRVATLEAFYDRLVDLLATQVLARARRGLQRAYQPVAGPQPVVRGRLDVTAQVRRPVGAHLPCRWELFSADTPDNRILAWTLHRLMQAGLASAATHERLQRAYRAVRGAVTLTPVTAAACAGRVYTRLNADYRPLHQLCRFFLDQLGPAFHDGERPFFPLLVNMERLFEQFVAAWLGQHVPAARPGWRVRPQETVRLGEDGALAYRADIVVRDAAGRARLVVDTKYKRVSGGVDSADINQIIAYAAALNCPDAVLIYPDRPARTLDVAVGRHRLRVLAFPLDADLAAAGAALLTDLLPAA